MLFSKPHNDGLPMGIREGRSRGAEQTSPRSSDAAGARNASVSPPATHSKQRSARFFGVCFVSKKCGVFLNGFIEKSSDEFSLIGVAFQSGDFSQSFVLVGADVGSGEFGSGLSLVRHGR